MKVYKIGGSSLNDINKLNSIKEILIKDKDKKIIVVSAIGRFNEPYATDTLLDKSKYVSKEEQDLLVSTGEIISSVLLSNFLNKYNISSYALSPYLFSINNIDKKLIYKYFKKYDCLIIPGFIYTKDNYIYTLSRGGSTTSSAILASVFSKELIIITDICGIYNIDPSNNNAKFIKKLTYDEFIKLNKSEVFFPKEAINILKSNNITTTFIKYDNSEKCSKIIP